MVILASEDALLERAVGNQADVQLAARCQDAIPLGCTMQQAVVHLVGCQREPAARERSVGVAHLPGRVVADANRPYLPGCHLIGQRVHEQVDAQERIRPVDLVEIDPRHAQAREAGVEGPCHLPSRPARGIRRELGGDDDTALVTPNQRAQDALRFAASIDLGGVEEVDARLAADAIGLFDV